MKIINKILPVIVTVFFLCPHIKGQSSGDRLIIQGDSLKGKVVDNINIREVIGNVVITQEDVKITCNKAIQYLKSNNAELIGNVIITQDSVIIKTERGRYFGNLKIAYSDSAVTLDNNEMNLIADKGNYNLNTKIANFFGNVKFRDSLNHLTSNKLVYYKNDEKIIATGNVVVKDTSSLIKSDSLLHLRNEKFSEGFGNIEIRSQSNNLSIFGDHFTDDDVKKVSKIDGNPFLTKIDTHENGLEDTLFISAKYLEAGKDSNSVLYAIDSVNIIRGKFASINNYTVYNREKDNILIKKQNENDEQILWHENTQVLGDTILIKLVKRKINAVDIINNAILISQDSTNEFRFNQMSGDSIFMSFNSGKLSKTDVRGNVLSIYYLLDQGKPNGLLKSSAKQIIILFENGRVSKVKMYGSPISEYHPENLIEGNEKDFTIPNFVIYKNKPDKEKIKKKYLKRILD